MPKLQCSLIRINAKNGQTDIWSGVDKENINSKVIHLMTLTRTTVDGRSSGLPDDVMLKRDGLLFWCVYRKTHSFEICSDEDRLKEFLVSCLSVRSTCFTCH